MVILNTCHIREKAAEKLFSELGRLRGLKAAAARRAAASMIIAVAGCVAQAEGAEILRRAPACRYRARARRPIIACPRWWRAPRAAPAPQLDTEFPAESKFDHPARSDGRRRASPPSSSVQEGCDKFCTFCVVPYTRGAEYSRPAAAVLAEAERLVARGAREITLLGQNVNAYHGAGPGRRATGAWRG